MMYPTSARPKRELPMSEVQNNSFRVVSADQGKRFDASAKRDEETSARIDNGREGAMSTEAIKSSEISERVLSLPGDCCYDNFRDAQASARRSSSLGVSLMTDYDNAFSASPPIPSGQVFMVNAAGEPTRPYRPMVGAGAAAAYEALRHDYYIQQKRSKHERRMSSLSFGSAKASGGHRGRHVNPEEQYEMLKLHHLNLMNEIQETALMLNLYEQKQLIRQQKEQMRQIQNLQLMKARSEPIEQDVPVHQLLSVEKARDDEHETCDRITVIVQVKKEASSGGMVASGRNDTTKKGVDELAGNTHGESTCAKKHVVDLSFAPNKRQKQSDNNSNNNRDGEQMSG